MGYIVIDNLMSLENMIHSAILLNYFESMHLIITFQNYFSNNSQTSSVKIEDICHVLKFIEKTCFLLLHVVLICNVYWETGWCDPDVDLFFLEEL